MGIDYAGEGDLLGLDGLKVKSEGTRSQSPPAVAGTIRLERVSTHYPDSHHASRSNNDYVRAIAHLITRYVYSLGLSVDNSEFMRNGDFTPSRFSAQSDAVSVIFGTKTQSNPENTVGVMTMAGKT